MARGYTNVEPTAAEIAQFRKARGYAPGVGRGSCDTCGKRIWISGLGIASHERSKAHRAADGAAVGSAPLTPAMEAALRYFADPTPENAAHCKALRAKFQTDMALWARGLIEKIDTFPYHQPTDAGHDWIEAKDDKVSEWIGTATRAGLPLATDETIVDAVRKALVVCARKGAKPGTAAAMLRALDARYPVAVTPIDATPAETIALLHDVAAQADAVADIPFNPAGAADTVSFVAVGEAIRSANGAEERRLADLATLEQRGLIPPQKSIGSLLDSGVASIPVRVGDRVRITDGSFIGSDGLVTRIGLTAGWVRVALILDGVARETWKPLSRVKVLTQRGFTTPGAVDPCADCGTGRADCRTGSPCCDACRQVDTHAENV